MRKLDGIIHQSPRAEWGALASVAEGSFCNKGWPGKVSIQVKETSNNVIK